MEDWLRDAYTAIERMPKPIQEIRELAKEDLFTFARLVHPGDMYEDIHKEFYRWVQE